MIRKKNIILIFTLLITFTTAVLIGANLSKDTPYDYIDLVRTAKTKGSVRVIIKIDVANIHELTQESNRFQTGNSDTAYIQEAAEADFKLERAISGTTDEVLYKLNGKDYKINHTFSTLPYLALELSPEALDVLRSLPYVLSIVEDRLTPLPETRRNSGKSNISQPQLNDSRKIVGAEKAWAMGYTGDGWYVAVLDSGINRNHEFFTGKSIVEQCYSLLHDCPNGQSSMSGPGSAAHIMAGESHGTHVAGIATGNNKSDMYGVAKGADIIAVQIFSYIAAWDDIGSYDSDQIKGLEFVYTKRNQYKIASVNMSLGSGEYFSPCDSENSASKAAIDNLRAAKIATIIATGNQRFCGAIDAPACISSAIAVSATDKEDDHWYFANWHQSMVDFFAPGVSITSSIAYNNSGYESWNGTSMATPHVSGAWAIMRQFDPSLSFDKVLKTLKDEGEMITSRCAASPRTPRVDVGAAIESLLSLAPPLNFAGVQHINRSLLQSEYLNVLTWQSNPLNDQNNQNIVKYKVYTVDSSGKLTLLAEVDANTFEYRHRMLVKGTEYNYAIKSVNDQGEDSGPAYATVAPLN